MSDIAVTHFPEKDLTILTVRGKLSASEIVKHASQSYQTNLVLWDLRETISSGLSQEEYHTIVQFMRTLSMPRNGGKTALVGNKDSPEFEVLYEYKKMMDATPIPIEYQVFSSMREAKMWLGVAD